MNFKSLGLAFVLSSVAFAASDPNFHIYLALGQSNMEGQGDIEAQDQTVDSRFQVLWSSDDDSCNNRIKGEWYDAVPPLAHCLGKLGPVDYFGRTLVKNLPSEVKVGVVVVAVSACDIQLYEKERFSSYKPTDFMMSRIEGYGGNPYERLVEMAKIAQQSGVIKGILLHQGETNAGQDDWPLRVNGVYENLLADLDLKAENVPLLAGEVVRSELGGICGIMNVVIDQLPNTIPTSHVISSEGLGHPGDSLHFSSASYRTLGERYALKMLELQGVPVAVSKGSSLETFVGRAVVYGNRVEVPISGIRRDAVSAKVYNMLGRELLDFSDSWHHESLGFETGNLPAGSYLLAVQSGSNVSLQKLFLTK